LDFIRISLVAFVTATMVSACAVAPAKPVDGQNNTVSAESGNSGPQAASNRPVTSDAPQLAPEYRIGVDDVVKVSVWRNENLSVTVPVRPDGMISIPLAGDVLAGGLTPTEVATSVRKKLSRYVRDPQVTVILTALHSHEYLSRVRVTGAVRTPVSTTFRQGMTVLDLVLAAGGVTEFAAPNRAKLYRKNGEKTAAMKIRLGDILNDGKLKTNLYLKPGDILTIPERLF